MKYRANSSVKGMIVPSDPGVFLTLVSDASIVPTSYTSRQPHDPCDSGKPGHPLVDSGPVGKGSTVLLKREFPVLTGGGVSGVMPIVASEASTGGVPQL